MAVPAEPAEPVVDRLGPAARAWRIVALIAGVVLAAQGTLVGNDVEWPFAPMSQFAFRSGRNDVVHSTFVQALTPAGRFVRVSLSPRSVGMARAEVEGQLPNFERNPALLSSLAAAYQRLHPGVPPMTQWYLCDRVTVLRDGRPAGVHVNMLVSWRPGSGPSQPLPGATPVATFDREIR